MVARSGACGGRLLARGDSCDLLSIGANRPAESVGRYGGIGEAGTDEVATAFGDDVAIDRACIVAHSPG